MDGTLKITQVGDYFPRFYPPVNVSSIEKNYQSRVDPNGFFLDCTEAIIEFDSRIEQAQTKNKKGPLSYNAYHSATNPYFNNAEKRVFYEEIIAAKLYIPEDTVATIVQNGNASNIIDFVKKVEDRSFKARSIGEKKQIFVTQIVEKYNAGDWPEIILPLSDDDSVFL